MVMQGISGEKAQVYLCREDVHVEVAGKASRLHTLYDWGATVTLVTHTAAKRAGLKRVRQPAAAIAGLSGRCTMVDSYLLHGVGRQQRRQGAEREGPGCGPHRNLDGHCRIPIRHFFSQSRRLLTKIFKSAETVNEKFRCL